MVSQNFDSYKMIWKQRKQKFFTLWMFNWIEIKRNSANIYLLKVNNRSRRKWCEICSKLTIKIPEQRHSLRSSVFIVNFEHISHLFNVFIVAFQQVNVNWELRSDMQLLDTTNTIFSLISLHWIRENLGKKWTYERCLEDQGIFYPVSRGVFSCANKCIF